MSKHPYQGIPATAHWRRAVSDLPAGQVDPVGKFKFLVRADDKVATAGSCFAQHIARHLASGGLQHYVVEPGHPIATPQQRETFGYGMFSARYGNLYTARQLLQLYDRAFGTFVPVEPVWRTEGGAFIDPFRPTVEPGGFASLEELLADRAQHLGAVRRLFETVDVFVFTLGLTEHWYSREDGAVFPVCPGVAGGEFDAQRHQFGNFSVASVVADLEQFQARLRAVNPSARIILTVSPVPLMATMEPRHVIQSTTVSKAVLRVAADHMERTFDNVAYFPSYEIITGPQARGQFFGPDLRSVAEDGVARVMGLFMRHAAGRELESATPPAAAVSPTEASTFDRDARRIVGVICDEDLIGDVGAPGGRSG